MLVADCSVDLKTTQFNEKGFCFKRGFCELLFNFTVQVL